jgi:hypothetical protein
MFVHHSHIVHDRRRLCQIEKIGAGTVTRYINLLHMTDLLTHIKDKSQISVFFYF